MWIETDSAIHHSNYSLINLSKTGMLVTTAIYSSYTERHGTSKKDISEHLNKNEVIYGQNINLRQGEEKVEGSKTDPEIIDSYQTVCILLCHF